MAKKRKKVTIYQKLQKAVSRNCKKGTPTTKKAVESAQKAYINDAVKKGKTPTEAKKIARKANTCKPVGKRK